MDIVDEILPVTERDAPAIIDAELKTAMKKVKDEQRRSDGLRNIHRQWTPRALDDA